MDELQTTFGERNQGSTSYLLEGVALGGGGDLLGSPTLEDVDPQPPKKLVI